MSGDLAKQYLVQYQQNSEPLLAKFLAQKNKEAKSAGKFPQEIIERLVPLAQQGKRFRGTLFTLGYQLACLPAGRAGKPINQAILDVSLAIELIHLGFLIQDDVMDRDPTRRGLPAYHAQFKDLHFGESMAINAGDLAFSFGWEKLLNSPFPAERRLESAQILFETFQSTVYGQKKRK